MALQKIMEKLGPSVKVLDTFRGLTAVKKASILFFKKDELSAKEWSKQWTTNEKRTAILVIYQWTARTQKHFGFKFVIGDNILGEKYRTTVKDNQFLELYRRL